LAADLKYGRFPGRSFRTREHALRIASKVALVGGIPTLVAAVIATVAWFLLHESEQARRGAVLAGSIYRDLLVATAERDRFVVAPPGERTAAGARFFELAKRSQADLQRLAQLGSGETRDLGAASRELAAYTDQMKGLSDATERNERLLHEMAERAATLISLADQARTRQHASNADIVASLASKDKLLREIGDIVDQVQQVRALAARGRLDAGGDTLALIFQRTELVNAVKDLNRTLQQAGREKDASAVAALLDRFQPLRPGSAEEAGASRALITWCEAILKVDQSAQRALHEEVSQLLTYSVQANETEQATQNIAIATLKLGQRTDDALTDRDISKSRAMVKESQELADTMARLPISPLIQSEMIDAITAWRDRLLTTIAGVEEQNALLTAMDRTSASLTETARSLNDSFALNADRLGATIRTMLVTGASLGLLLATLAALLVARSITQPLHRLQHSMLALAREPVAGTIKDANRTDELGDMARAANTFIDEIVMREGALRQAVDRADSALADLKRTQANLIQAEKLASLGQLVAGVAHEINTPVGVALTTATLMRDEATTFSVESSGKQLLRSRLEAFVERMNEGGRLLYLNLTRAADLINSFKQVAADQVSGERRVIAMADWLNELMTSLGPMLRKLNLTVRVDCPPELRIETFPGALGQVVTNLVVNAGVHAYPDGQGGRVEVTVEPRGRDRLALTVRDYGRGIPPEHLQSVFDPFFTTARQHGSTGLGLHIAYNIVAQTLRGQIRIESRVGQGTTFIIEFPVDRAAPARPAAKGSVKERQA
jgi:signal transduction histidine kinase